MHQIYGTGDQSPWYQICKSLSRQPQRKSIVRYLTNLAQFSDTIAGRQKSEAIEGSLVLQIHSEALKEDFKIFNMLYIRPIC